MDEPTFFELPERLPAEASSQAGGQPRLRVAVRDQVVVRMLALDQMLPFDDEARVVWDFVCQCDLSPLLAQVRAVEGVVGRKAGNGTLNACAGSALVTSGLSFHRFLLGCPSKGKYIWLVSFSVSFVRAGGLADGRGLVGWLCAADRQEAHAGGLPGGIE